MRQTISFILFLCCSLFVPSSMGSTYGDMTKGILMSLPGNMQHDYADAIHKKLPRAVFVPKFKTVHGLYRVHRKVCSLRGCHATSMLYCYSGTPSLFGLKISDNQFFGYSRSSSCIKTVLKNTKHKFYFEADCYNSGLNFGKHTHVIHHVIHTVQFIHTGKRSFNKITTVKMNYPIVFSGVHIYSHYQFRSRSCLVKKLPQLHHG